MIYFFIISVTLNIFSLSKLYIDGSSKKKLQAIINDYKQLITAYEQLKTEHKQVIKQLEASYKSNYKDMMRAYIELKKANFNDDYIYNYMCKK